jgi:hypothetical protein
MYVFNRKHGKNECVKVIKNRNGSRARRNVFTLLFGLELTRVLVYAIRFLNGRWNAESFTSAQRRQQIEATIRKNHGKQMNIQDVYEHQT